MSQPKPREDRAALGVGIALFCFLVFTGMDSIAKYLAGKGYSPIQVAFFRYTFHFLLVLIWFLPREGTEILRAARPGVQVLRALCLLGSTVLNFFAVRYLPLPVTISIFFASPLLISLMAIPILGERIGIRRLSAIVVGFMGVLVITQPWSTDFHWAFFLSLGAVTCASLYFTLTRAVAGTDTNATSQFFAAGIATLTLLPAVLGVWVTPQSLADLALLVVIGLMGFGGHALITQAYRYAEASTLAPVVYSQMFYATVISWLVFSVVPGPATYVGSGIIIASGLYIWLRERQLRKPASSLGGNKPLSQITSEG